MSSTAMRTFRIDLGEHLVSKQFNGEHSYATERSAGFSHRDARGTTSCSAKPEASIDPDRVSLMMPRRDPLLAA